MKKSNLLFPTVARVLAGTFFAFAASHALADNGVINSTDKSFLQSAYEDGLAEIHMAGLGVKKTANADVKAYAEKLEADHGQANGELKTLADNKKVTLATSPSMVATGKEKLLDARTGGSFDKAFIDGMVNDHKKAIASFEKAANDSKDPDVKAFAAKTLPTLKSHLSTAEELQQKIGK